MNKARKTILVLVAMPVTIVAIVAIAWAVTYARQGDDVARGVTLAGVDVSGKSPKELDATLGDISAKVAAMPVVLKTSNTTIESTASVIGLHPNDDSTRAAVLAVGRSGAWVERPLKWVQSFFTTSEIPVYLEPDAEKLTPALVQLESDKRVDPVEPLLDVSGEKVALTPGTDGSALRMSDVARSLPSQVTNTAKTIRIKVEPTIIPTRTTNEQVQKLADSANRITESPLTITWGDKKAEIPGSDLRSSFVMIATGDGPQLSMDADKVAEVLTEHTAPSLNPTKVRFEINNGVPTPVGGEDTRVCCGPGSPDLIVKALLGGKKSVEVPSRVMTAEEGRKWAAGLGVKEVIGEFTTRHACCQSRVTNIHRISDIMRGVLIPPKGTISVNGIVGKRTTKNGFVAGGVILEGEHTTDVGGGVSQFATTTFNAAFFAGLEIPEYQSHSEWLSRYPFGREATLWYPSVDLKIHNNTPYGVVVWTSYTNTSVTVQMWSTRYVSGEQTAQSPTSGCGKITTTRTRTWVDGRTAKDKFFASYRC